MDLRRVVAAVLHWRWALALVLLVCVGGAAAYAALAPREYASTTTVFFSLSRTSSVSDLAQGSTYTEDVAKSYSEVVTLPLVLGPVIGQLGLDETPAELAKRVTVETQPDTVLADITVTDPEPQRAAEIANAVGRQLAASITTLSPSGTAATSPIKVTTISDAVPPSGPSSPNVRLLLVVGCVAGLALGLALTVVLELVVSPVVTAAAAASVAPVLGRIPYDSKAKALPLPVSTHPQLPRAESFRARRTNLRRLEEAESVSCLVVTSALPQEGRTSVAINLAMAFSHSFRNVLLVEADLRRPSIAQILGIDGTAGLADVLMDEASLDNVTQTWQTQTWRDATLHVLPAGQRTLDASGLLARPTMTELLETTRAKYDLVILDSPPLVPVTDGALLASQADGALLVVRAGKTHERDFGEAVSSLRLAGADIVGVAFNAAPARRFNRIGPQMYGPRRHIWKR
jgi:capsular exopolysaccharide synthesis family protein